MASLCDQERTAPRGRLLIKVLVLGAANAGKTSLVERYCLSSFSGQRRPTIGADFKTKTLDALGNEEREVVLQLWDTAGAERFQSQLGSTYYRNSDGALLVYDCGSEESVRQLVQWRNEVMSRVVPGFESYFPLVVCANKTDLKDGSPSACEAIRGVQAWCKESGYPHVETSAKDGTGVAAAMMGIAALALEARKNKPQDDVSTRQSIVLGAGGGGGGLERELESMYTPQRNQGCAGGGGLASGCN